MKDSNIRIGITHGDINGIGYEVIMKTLSDSRMLEFCTPIIYGSPKVAAYHRKAVGIDNLSMNIVNSSKEAREQKINIINCIDENTKVELGKESIVSGDASFKSLELSVDDILSRKIDVLVTAPVNKHSVYTNRVDCTGHSEYLSQRMNNVDVMTILIGNSLKIGTATGHVPISKLGEMVTEENILNKLRIMNNSLKNDFTIRKPKIAVLGFNPHLGDMGMWGEEEKNIISPAIEKARDQGIMAIGPFSADGFFASDNFKKFDAVLAMYHDQGMIPFKTIEGNSGVVYTAGLPIVRTAPAHGVAYDLVGKGVAIEDGFRNALYLAIDIFRNRKVNKEISKNPLPKYEVSNTRASIREPNVEDLEDTVKE